MPRYLQAESVVHLVGAGSKKLPKVIDTLGLHPEQAHKLRHLWILRIHGRCVRCESQLGTSCECPANNERIGDNRSPRTVLDRLPTQTVLMKVPCCKCRKPTPYTVRNALWRLNKESDWDAFFRCKACLKKAREDRRERIAKEVSKKEVSKVIAKKEVVREKVKKTEPLKSIAAPPKRRSSALTHRPFSDLNSLGNFDHAEIVANNQDQSE